MSMRSCEHKLERTSHMGNSAGRGRFAIRIPVSTVEERFLYEQIKKGSSTRVEFLGLVENVLSDESFFDFDFAEILSMPESDEHVDIQVSKNNYPQLCGLYQKAPSNTKGNFVRVILRRVASMLENNPYLVNDVCNRNLRGITSPLKTVSVESTEDRGVCPSHAEVALTTQSARKGMFVEIT